MNDNNFRDNYDNNSFRSGNQGNDWQPNQFKSNNFNNNNRGNLYNNNNRGNYSRGPRPNSFDQPYDQRYQQNFSRNRQPQKELPSPEDIPIEADPSIVIRPQNSSPFSGLNNVMTGECSREKQASVHHLDEFGLKSRKYEPRAEKSGANQVFAFP